MDLFILPYILFQGTPAAAGAAETSNRYQERRDKLEDFEWYKDLDVSSKPVKFGKRLHGELKEIFVKQPGQHQRKIQNTKNFFKEYDESLSSKMGSITNFEQSDSHKFNQLLIVIEFRHSGRSVCCF